MATPTSVRPWLRQSSKSVPWARARPCSWSVDSRFDPAGFAVLKLRLRAEPFDLLVFSVQLITKVIENLVNLVHAVSPQPQGETQGIDVGRLGLGGQHHRRQVGYGVVKAGADGASPDNPGSEVQHSADEDNR